MISYVLNLLCLTASGYQGLFSALADSALGIVVSLFASYQALGPQACEPKSRSIC
jgi:hypothetical protein